MKRGPNTYQKINTMGMSQLDLILTVYRVGIASVTEARNDFRAENLVAGRTACDKARKCIVHLYTTLDMERGGAIARHLGQLYAFMIEQLDLAVAEKSCDLLDNVIDNLNTLKEGWEGLKEADIAGADTPPPAADAADPGVPRSGQPVAASLKSRLTLSA